MIRQQPTNRTFAHMPAPPQYYPVALSSSYTVCLSEKNTYSRKPVAVVAGHGLRGKNWASIKKGVKRHLRVLEKGKRARDTVCAVAFVVYV